MVKTEEEKQVPQERFVRGDLVKDTEPTILDTTKEEGKQAMDLHTIIAVMANKIDRIEKTLVQ